MIYKNAIEIEGDVARVHLTRGKTTLMDTADLPNLRHRTWVAVVCCGKSYAVATTTDYMRKTVVIRLASIIMQPPTGMVVDHISGDSLDNRRSNLRIATYSQNGANSRIAPGRSGYRGVRKDGQRYRAMITVKGKQLHLGCFGTAEEAAVVYNMAAQENFGDFAQLNEVSV